MKKLANGWNAYRVVTYTNKEVIKYDTKSKSFKNVMQAETTIRWNMENSETGEVQNGFGSLEEAKQYAELY